MRLDIGKPHSWNGFNIYWNDKIGYYTYKSLEGTFIAAA